MVGATYQSIYEKFESLANKYKISPDHISIVRTAIQMLMKGKGYRFSGYEQDVWVVAFINFIIRQYGYDRDIERLCTENNIGKEIRMIRKVTKIIREKLGAKDLFWDNQEFVGTAIRKTERINFTKLKIDCNFTDAEIQQFNHLISLIPPELVKSQTSNCIVAGMVYLITELNRPFNKAIFTIKIGDHCEECKSTQKYVGKIFNVTEVSVRNSFRNLKKYFEKTGDVVWTKKK